MLDHENYSVQDETSKRVTRSLEISDLGYRSSSAMFEMDSDSIWNFEDEQWVQDQLSPIPPEEPATSPPAEGSPPSGSRPGPAGAGEAATMGAEGGAGAASVAAAAATEAASAASLFERRFAASVAAAAAAAANNHPGGQPVDSLPSLYSLKDLMTQSVVCLDTLGDAPTLDDVLTGPDDPAGCSNLLHSIEGSQGLLTPSQTFSTPSNASRREIAGGSTQEDGGKTGEDAEGKESTSGQKAGAGSLEQRPSASPSAAPEPNAPDPASEQETSASPRPSAEGREEAGSGTSKQENPGIGNESKML